MEEVPPVNDPIETAAKTLTADEARILARFANNESAGDIAITLEMDRARVIAAIRNKGRDNRVYASRITAAWAQNNNLQVPAGDHLSSDVITGPDQSSQVPASALRYLTGPTLPAATPGPASPVKASAASRPVKKTPASAPSSEEPQLPGQPSATAVPGRAADLPLARPEVAAAAKVEPAEPAPSWSGLTFEALLGRAESCGNPNVELAAKNLRADLATLNKALGVVAQATLIEREIGVLDADIDERTKRREDLRGQLKALMDSNVMVSATSGRLRTETSAEPDDATLRSWGRENGFKIQDRGRVPQAVLAGYLQAHGLAA